jgi:hypothetical protein
MISRQIDSGRTAYARAITDRRRRNIFVGTTNDDTPLEDITGNRRFLPVHIRQEIDLGWLRANVGQLVGEAASLEAAGQVFDIPRSVWAAAFEHQEAARSESDMETRLGDWFAPTSATGTTAYIVAADLAELAALAGWRGNNAARGAAMKALGFRCDLRPVINGKRTRVWLRGPNIVRESDIPRLGTRYVVGVDANGRARVTIAVPATDVPATRALVLPTLPQPDEAPRS